MTDNEIIKALECFRHRILNSRLADKVTAREMMSIVNALDLINCQKAEIEWLQNRNITNCRNWQTKYNSLKIEAYKEFAERLRFEIVNKPSEFKASQATVDFLNGGVHRHHEILDILDTLLKELVGEGQ